MKIIINGIHANLRFASAHMIPCHQYCGGIHGHSYHVDVVVEGERGGEFGFVADFKTVKGLVRVICKELDHKLLIPAQSKELDFKNIENPIEFYIGEKHYLLPPEDCLLLPLPSTSAEELSKYFAERIFQDLQEIDAQIESVQICVNEGIGQGAYYTIDR